MLLMNSDYVAEVLRQALLDGHIRMGANEPLAVSGDIVREGIVKKWQQDMTPGGIGNKATEGMNWLVNYITSLEKRVAALEKKV
jgi:hypothetical protein